MTFDQLSAMTLDQIAEVDVAAAEAAAAAAQLVTDKAAVVTAKGDIRKDVSILGTTGEDRGALLVTENDPPCPFPGGLGL